MRVHLYLLPLACLAALPSLAKPGTPEKVAAPAKTPAPAAVRTPPVQIPPLPETPKRPVSSEYHGVTVTEDYRWLEDDSAPEVKAWSAEQNRHTRAALDAIPARKQIAARLKDLVASQSVSYYDLCRRGGRLFALKFQPPRQQPYLVVMPDADKRQAERTVMDPNRTDPTGATAIDFYVPSWDGKQVAVSLSKDGTEDGSVRVFDVATGNALPDLVPRVNYPTGGGSLAWRADNKGFFYTRYPQGDERAPEDANFYQEVYYHALGSPAAEDAYVLGGDFPRIAETELRASEDGQYLLATVANGDGGEYAHYLQSPPGWWRQVTTFGDEISKAVLGPDGMLYLISHKRAGRGKVLRLPVTTPDLSEAKLIIPEGENAIVDVIPTENRLYVVEVAGGPSRIRVYDHQGQDGRTVPLPPVSAVGQVLRDGKDRILFESESYTQPDAWYRYDPASGQVTRTALYKTSPARFDDVEVIRAFATSRDGTKVPLTVLMKKGTKLDGTNPLLLTGYGGYGIVESPYFDSARRLWLDAGGIWADANIRGGGEYGEDWHRAGNLTKKQNGFDDFAAVAQYLIHRKYTSTPKLAIEGASNGGLLMGAMITQHPDLFRAVVSHAGTYDCLRDALSPNGEFNTTEFGSVKDPAQFKALYAYSPYHNVRDGTPYPAVLLTAGDNDGRVPAFHSRKFAARLQASGTKRPVLLRTSFTGHGPDSALDETLAEEADAFAFLFRQLGMGF